MRRRYSRSETPCAIPPQTALAAAIDASANPRPGAAAATLAAEARGEDLGSAGASGAVGAVAAKDDHERTRGQDGHSAARYVDGVDLASQETDPSASVDHRVLPPLGSAWRGYDLPGFPEGVPAPFEVGYEGRYGIDDDATMEEAIEAYAAALAAYDAVHGPPAEAAEDEARLKHERASGMGYRPLYPEVSPGGADVHTTAEAAWSAMVDESAKARRARGAAAVLDLSVAGDGSRAERTTGEQRGDSGEGSGERVDCGFPGITEQECVEQRGCRWDDSAVGVPWCFR